MIERVKDRFGLRPQRLAGDTVYGAVRLLKWLVDRQITPHIPVWDKSARTDGTFSRADFVFDRSRNVYICPDGKLLHTQEPSSTAVRFAIVPQSAIAMSARSKCGVAPHAARHIPRDLHEDARDVARALAKTELTNNHAVNAKKSRCDLRI